MTPEKALEMARALVDYCEAKEYKPGTTLRWVACKDCVFLYYGWCAIQDPDTWTLRYMEDKTNEA